jgi:hypothetical protein
MSMHSSSNHLQNDTRVHRVLKTGVQTNTFSGNNHWRPVPNCKITGSIIQTDSPLGQRLLFVACVREYSHKESRHTFFSVSLGGVRLSPLGTSATIGLLYQARMIDDDYGMRISRGNRSTRRKPAPVPLCLPQISHVLTWDPTRVAAVGSQRLSAWAMARPLGNTLLISCRHSSSFFLVAYITFRST